jgi:hypothetical protein
MIIKNDKLFVVPVENLHFDADAIIQHQKLKKRKYIG